MQNTWPPSCFISAGYASNVVGLNYGPLSKTILFNKALILVF